MHRCSLFAITNDCRRRFKVIDGVQLKQAFVMNHSAVLTARELAANDASGRSHDFPRTMVNVSGGLYASPVAFPAQCRHRSPPWPDMDGRYGTLQSGDWHLVRLFLGVSGPESGPLRSDQSSVFRFYGLTLAGSAGDTEDSAVVGIFMMLTPNGASRKVCPVFTWQWPPACVV